MPPCTLDIAAIQPKRKAVDNRELVAGLARKGSRGIALRIADVMCPSVVGLEGQAAACPMSNFDLHRLVVLKTEILSRERDSPVLERRPRIYERARHVRQRAWSDLIQVDSNVQTVGVHADVTHPHCGIRGQFPFDG